ncbi:hypothetical protein [Paenibacillus sp. 1P07SE]|uniref:hypothetical protein n=1 Tax=Paenibacillus sp. 1P07SE TaxID=3132209 RepID=UPI0039A5EA2A
MFKKWLSRIKQRGENNIALINSEVNVMVKHSVYEDLARLTQAGDYEQIANLMKEFQKRVETSHPCYPHYRYRVKKAPDGTMYFEHEPVNREASRQLPLTYNLQFSLKDNILQQEGKSIDDVLEKAYATQEVVHIDLIALQAIIADQQVETPLLDKMITDFDWVIKPLEVPAPLKLSLHIIAATSGERYDIIPYFELTLADLNLKKDMYVFNNHRQEGAKLFIRLEVPRVDIRNATSRVKTNALLHFEINPNFKNEVDTLLRFQTFFKIAEEDSIILIKNVISHETFVEVDLSNFKLKPNGIGTTESIELLKKLKIYEDFFSVSFRVPDRLEANDREGLKVLESIYSKTPIIFNYKDISVRIEQKSDLEKIIKLYEEKSVTGIEVFESSEKHEAKLLILGATIPLQEKRTLYKSTRVENLELLKRKLQYMEDGDVVNFRLLPGSSSEVKETYKLLPK